MDDHLPAAVEVVRTLAPQARAFAETIGALDPQRSRSVLRSLSDGLYLRCEERRAVMFTEAARRLKAAGVPAQAVADPVLHAILTHGSLEQDPELQAAWTNLLSNAAAGKGIPPALPEILRQLEPIEARVLDSLVTSTGRAKTPTVTDFARQQHRGLYAHHWDNLERLGLVFFQGREDPLSFHAPIPPPSQERDNVGATALGARLVSSCREPLDSV